ncbi:hypothetical protein PPYR_03974 [Photinus pyralis]|uniref:Alpha-carbonic anhydrase domain-containing protein n=1 Tax=Photinus pyralis TaxID=7054 RepID=A0A5N4AX08_PHOPY|nr:carbonic anhydrase 2-like [Photinus pyralis]KAB0801788.1 hypothetical protein PPYR_03974 [Photinus pyralis]
MEDEQVMEEEENIEDKAEWFQKLVDKEGLLESPINICLSICTPLDLPSIDWYYLDVIPKKVKLTNTGRTLLMSINYIHARPFVSSGPFCGNFEFSQLHFHWGANDMKGSEHSADGVTYPLEMHVVYFRSMYVTHEAALRQKDGVAVFVYLFKLQAAINPIMQLLVEAIPRVQKPRTSTRFKNIPLQFLLKKFQMDYFLYWGSVRTNAFIHFIFWLICREPIGITREQMEAFRMLLDNDEKPLLSNYRPIQEKGKRRLFHVSSGTVKYATLLPISQESEEFCLQREITLTSE